MDALLTTFTALAAYFGALVRTPVALVKGPDVIARIRAARSVTAYAFGAALPDCTVEDVLAAYCARKVTLLDYGTSIVVMARYGRGRGTPADTRFVVK